MKCPICKRVMLEHTDKWYEERSVNCGGDCSGCVAVMEGNASYAPCAFHGRDCVVANHYAESVHLCNPAQCIEHQDITTLMINSSMQRWKDGEQNEFFDRITQPIDLANCVDLTGLSNEEVIKSLFGKP
jgi:hypothetical protein